MNIDKDKEKQLEHVIRPFRQSSYIIDVGFGFLENWLEDLDKNWQNNGNRGLNLSPDFQRGHVWTDQQRSRYVEYVLRGGNAQLELQWNHPHWDGVVPTDLPLEMQIIDGKQRLEAVRMFLREEITAFDRRASYFKGTSFDPKRSFWLCRNKVERTKNVARLRKIKKLNYKTVQLWTKADLWRQVSFAFSESYAWFQYPQ